MQMAKRFIIFFFIFCYMLLGGGLFGSTQEFFNMSVKCNALAQSAEGIGKTGNPFIQWTLFFSIFFFFWFFFYKVIYPWLLNYYHPKHCQKLFWLMFGLYSITWLAISFYIVFDVGWLWWSYLWAKWVFLAIGVFWFICLLWILLRKDPGYN